MLRVTADPQGEPEWLDALLSSDGVDAAAAEHALRASPRNPGGPKVFTANTRLSIQWKVLIELVSLLSIARMPTGIPALTFAISAASADSTHAPSDPV